MLSNMCVTSKLACIASDKKNFASMPKGYSVHNYVF